MRHFTEIEGVSISDFRAYAESRDGSYFFLDPNECAFAQYLRSKGHQSFYVGLRYVDDDLVSNFYSLAELTEILKPRLHRKVFFGWTEDWKVLAKRLRKLEAVMARKPARVAPIFSAWIAARAVPA